MFRIRASEPASRSMQSSLLQPCWLKKLWAELRADADLLRLKIVVAWTISNPGHSACTTESASRAQHCIRCMQRCVTAAGTPVAQPMVLTNFPPLRSIVWGFRRCKSIVAVIPHFNAILSMNSVMIDLAKRETAWAISLGSQFSRSWNRSSAIDSSAASASNANCKHLS